MSNPVHQGRLVGRCVRDDDGLVLGHESAVDDAGPASDVAGTPKPATDMGAVQEVEEWAGIKAASVPFNGGTDKRQRDCDTLD
ncbi:hypothetical protein VTK26DRAFT_4631 [Humicola hyalothermophila]